jgi:hypothetical protein
MRITEEVQGLIQQLLGPDVVVIIVQGAGKAAGVSTGPDGSSEFRQDLTVRQFLAEFAPDMSASRVREWCCSGEFPASKRADGSIVPGAYKAGNQWYITREGIAARQQQARDRAASRTRKAAAPRTAPSAKTVRTPAPARQSTTAEAPVSAEPAQERRRPRQDAWRAHRKAG